MIGRRPRSYVARAAGDRQYLYVAWWANRNGRYSQHKRSAGRVGDPATDQKARQLTIQAWRQIIKDLEEELAQLKKEAKAYKQ